MTFSKGHLVIISIKRSSNLSKQRGSRDFINNPKITRYTHNHVYLCDFPKYSIERKPLFKYFGNFTKIKNKCIKIVCHSRRHKQKNL